MDDEFCDDGYDPFEVEAEVAASAHDDDPNPYNGTMSEGGDDERSDWFNNCHCADLMCTDPGCDGAHNDPVVNTDQHVIFVDDDPRNAPRNHWE